MIEGTLRIHWDNNDAPADARMYRVSFVANAGGGQDGQGFKEILGAESLTDYLIEIQPAGLSLDRRAERAEAWVSEVHKAGRYSLEKIVLTEEQFQAFSAA